MPKRWIDYILSHPDKDWDWCQISINPNVEFEDFEAHPTTSIHAETLLSFWHDIH
jgi:hypothetical protein